MAVLTLFVMSCNRDKVSDADLVVVDHGNMSFYDVEAQKLIPYEKETDSVLNLLFDDNSHLYYTVTKGDNLLLKMVDMNQSSPTPKECAYWNMGLMNAHESWTDIRRTGYPHIIPATAEGNKSNGLVDSEFGARRMKYPSDEYINNGANLRTAVSTMLGGADEMSTRTWFDCNPKVK